MDPEPPLRRVHGLGSESIRIPDSPIEASHTAHLAGLAFPSDHKDPFDRLIVSQAIVEGISVVSADAKLDAYPVNRLW